MFTKDERNYLAKIDPKKRVSIYPFDPKAKQLGESVVEKIKKHFPHLKVLFMGSVALEIAGQKDIDIYALSDPKHFRKYQPAFRKLFGKPAKRGKYVGEIFIEWKYQKDGYEIEVYLTEPPERQIRVFEILKSNKKLLKKYENLKLLFDGKIYKNYQRAKYEFYNKILTTNSKDFLGKNVEVIMDRPMNTKHPKWGWRYPINYGYVPNTKSTDGKELDVFFLGLDRPVKEAKGICIAIIHRTDDEDKLVVVPKGVKLSDEEIEKQIEFQEKWFKHVIIRK